MSGAILTPVDEHRHREHRLRVDEARRRIFSEITPVHGIERIALRGALGRVLAHDVLSPVNVPAHANSAVDGYALAGADLPAREEREYRIAGTAWAGRPFAGAVQAGECVRIMTGAPLPRGTDTVVMQEHVRAQGESVHIGAGHEPGRNVRAAGEDLAKDDVALSAGKRLMPADLGLLASIGMAEIGVHRPLRVAFFSTGDELRSLGEPLGAGEIYDSNRYTLYGMLRRLNVDLLDLGVIRDQRAAVSDAFAEASSIADAVITSGGVSVGEADYVKEVVNRLGRVSFWQIAMKPGRPLAFGRIGNAAFFGLPGNPVAVMVTFYQFVQPALRHMAGERNFLESHRLFAHSASRFKKLPGRVEFQRAIMESLDGKLAVRSTGTQGSGILRSMSRANCFVVLPEEAETVEPGALVEIQPFFGLV
jgi:molybdopterin molybdotransferase